MGRPRKINGNSNGISLREKAQELLDKELDDKRINAIAKCLRQIEKNKVTLTEYKEKNDKLFGLIKRIELGDEQALREVGGDY